MGRVKIQFDAKKENFDKGAEAIKKSLDTIKEMVIGAFAADKVIEFGKSAIEMGKDLVNTATGLGITIEQVQVLKKMAEDTGTSFDQLGMAINRVAVLRDKALHGDTKAQDTLTALGANKATLGSTSSYDLLFKTISDKIKSTNTDAIANPLSKALGENFGQILPALKGNIEETTKDMEEMGEIMSAQTAVKLKMLGNEFDDISTILKVTVGSVLVDIMDSLVEMIGTNGSYLNTVFAGLEEWAEWFKGSKASGFTSANGTKFTAEDRKDDAQGLINNLEQSMKDQKKYLPNADPELRKDTAYQETLNWMKGKQAFTDYKGNNMGDLEKYANGLIQHYTDASNDRWSNVSSPEELKKGLVNQMAALKAKIAHDSITTQDGLGNTSDEKNKLNKHGLYSDNLTQSGNLLGSSFDNISMVSQQLKVQKDSYLEFQKHTLSLEKIANSLSALNNPLAVFN